MVELQKSRSVKPNGEAITRLRKAKLWRVEDLAKRAGVSAKTVESVERGANVYMFTLAKFATAFKVENSVLIAGGEVPPELPKTQRRIEVNLTISIPFEEFDQSEQLISLIQSLKAVVNAQDHIELTGLMASSTVVTLEMSEADVHSLISAFMSGKLDEMQVQQLNLRLAHGAPASDPGDPYAEDLANIDTSNLTFSPSQSISLANLGWDDVRGVEEEPASKDDKPPEEAEPSQEAEPSEKATVKKE